MFISPYNILLSNWKEITELNEQIHLRLKAWIKTYFKGLIIK